MIGVNEYNVIFKLNRRTRPGDQSSFSYLPYDVGVQGKFYPRAYSNVAHTGITTGNNDCEKNHICH